MQLCKTLKGSLKLFKPSQLKLFLLITSKSVMQACKIVCWYFWPLIVAIIWIHNYKNDYQGSLPSWLMLIDIVLHILFVFFIFVAIRSSLSQKNISYFMYQLPYVIPFSLCAFVLYGFNVLIMHKAGLVMWLISLLFALATGALGLLFLNCFANDMALTLMSDTSWHVVFVFAQLWLVPLIAFFALFLLDSDGRPVEIVRSLHRAIIMIFYNYPAVMLLHICVTVLYSIVIFLIWMTPVFPYAPWGLLLAPIPIGIFAYFYIKFVHAQFSLYYGEKKSS